MAKQTTDELYPVYYLDLEELMKLPEKRQMTPTTERYSTGDPRDVMDIARDAKDNDQRMLIQIHDENSNLMIPHLVATQVAPQA